MKQVWTLLAIQTRFRRDFLWHSPSNCVRLSLEANFLQPLLLRQEGDYSIEYRIQNEPETEEVRVGTLWKWDANLKIETRLHTPIPFLPIHQLLHISLQSTTKIFEHSVPSTQNNVTVQFSSSVNRALLNSCIHHSWQWRIDGRVVNLSTWRVLWDESYKSSLRMFINSFFVLNVPEDS